MSLLWIAGCSFSPGPSDSPDPTGDPGGTGTVVETTGQTAIDRFRGSAAAGSLRFSRLVASGGTLTAYLRHDAADGGTLSAADLDLIAAWRPVIGRDRTKGGGRAALTSLRHGTTDPATAEGARTWLSHSGPNLFEAVATQTISCMPGGDPWLQERFTIAEGFLTGDGLPSRVARTQKRLGEPLIPGSAWKGIIRSRTEFILRSRYGEAAACRQQTGCGNCPVCAVFGHQGQRGLLAFRDSSIEEPIYHDQRTQVGIDRVTGGSREALLFSTEALASGQVLLRIDALGDIPAWVRNVINHVLRDIDDGLIGAGSRTTRGLGTLHLASQPDPPGPVVVPELETPDTTRPEPGH